MSNKSASESIAHGLATKMAKKSTMQCGSCGVTRLEEKLSLCKACKCTLYCSRECQKKDWSSHKSTCKFNQEQRASESGKMQSKIAGMSSSDAYLSLRAWGHHHRPALLWASWNAFDLKNHPKRMDTSVFVVVADVIPAALSGAEQDPVRMFSLQEATLMEKRNLTAFHPQAADLVATSDNHHAQTNTDATSMLVFCPGVAINLIPSLDVLSHRPEAVKDWKTFLIQSTRLK